MIKKILLVVAFLIIVLAGVGIWWFQKTGKTDQFIKLAADSVCADKRNDVYQIDSRFIFWAREGSCPDNSYSYNLYDATPQKLVCSDVDSIAGPRISCTDQAQEKLFRKMVVNLDAANLGLSADHSVKKLVLDQ